MTRTNRFGEIIFNQDDLFDLTMQGTSIWNKKRVVVDDSVDIQSLISVLENPSDLLTWTFPESSDIAVVDWDNLQQQQWFMPPEYQDLDIAEHVLGLCKTQEQLQRVGEELLLFQERGLFDLLKYLKYLVDVMDEHKVIWGVGRGSSVASYVLYLLRVHRIDSMFYDLDPREFLR